MTVSSSKIKLLPPELVNRIAAGEVVERPASVIKELVENALDAGATRLEIEVLAGANTLRVADNGEGMSCDDVQTAFLNHATSKIRSQEDLDAIATLGFRGEALASISAISRFSCTTRRAEDPNGTRLLIEGGAPPQISPAGCAVGTTMQVADLFFNTPARRKFLKRPQTEVAAIEELVEALALSHPQVAFALSVDAKPKLKTSGSGNLLQTLTEVAGFSAQNNAQHLLAIDFEDPTAGLKLSGYVASPAAMHLHRRSKKGWWLLLNNRVVKCPTLAKALEGALESLIPHGVYPLAVLQITMPATDVDVNVHPSKREVRYARPNEVFAFVRHGVRQAMTDFLPNTFNPEFAPVSLPLTHGAHDLTGFSPTHIGASVYRPPGAFNQNQLPVSPALTAAFPQAMAQNQPTKANSPSEENAPQQWRVIGQLFNTYVLLETRKGLMVVDQHIASERYCFERLARQQEEAQPHRQTLLVAQAVPLSPTQLDLLEEHRLQVEGLGFAWQAQAQAALLQAVPLIYPQRTQLSPAQQLMHVVETLAASGKASLELENLWATLACHTAVRAGEPLTEPQMQKLIEDWLTCTLPWTCPHGRPIAHTLEAHELNRFFDRPSLPVNSGLS